MAIFGPFIGYLSIIVGPPNLVAKIYEGFLTSSWSLVRFWLKMYLWQTIYDNTHTDTPKRFWGTWRRPNTIELHYEASFHGTPTR